VRSLLLLLAVLLIRPAAAQDDVDIDHETWSVIGWNDACGVAFEHFYYPKLGEELVQDPIETHIGTAMIAPGKEDYVARWTFEATGRLSWNERSVAKTEKDLKKAGFARAGYPELIQDAPIGNQPLLAETILSTATLQARLKKSAWPPMPEWRWAGGSYSPLGTCALLSFEKRGSPRHYRLVLLRVYNPRARLDRAYAHASNARLLFNSGTLDIAATEAETAAALAPELPIARYEHAVMLSMTGNANEAMDELAAAIKLDASYADKARDDLDFADLKGRQDFQDMTHTRSPLELNKD
jgi:hypothetical protein